MAERQYTWYVEPRNEHTNRVIADLMEHKGIADADAQPAVSCDDGQTRGLWSCPREVIRQLERSGMSGLDYRVWVQENHRPVRLWRFQPPSTGASATRTRSRHSRRAA